MSAAQVIPPTFEPEGGAYSRHVSVTITCSTPDSIIRFTRDGKDPHPLSEIYAGSIILGSSTEIRAQAWKEGVEPSNIAAANYVVAGTISTGEGHTLALSVNGTLRGWGTNNAGQVGAGNGSAANITSPVYVSLSDVVDVAAGGQHSLAILGDGSVWAWGLNSNGQLGLGGTNTAAASPRTPLKVTAVAQAVGVAGGDDFSLFLKPDHCIVAAGNSANGRLGYLPPTGSLATRYTTPVPVQIEATGLDLTNVETVSAGGGHALALQTSGKVWAWGLGTSGQLGNGAKANKNRAVPVIFPASYATTGITRGKIIMLAAGSTHSLALDENGRVWAWGANNYGQLGTGDKTLRMYPVEVMKAEGIPVAGAVHISAGTGFSLITLADGSLLSMGYGNVGRLGVGDTLGRVYASPVLDSAGAIIRNVAFASAGDNFGMALLQDGTLFGWGTRANGRLTSSTSGNAILAESIEMELAEPCPIISVVGNTTAPASGLIMKVDPRDSPANVTTVNFYLGESLIASKAAPPYEFPLDDAGYKELGVGRYNLHAIVQKANGVQTHGSHSLDINPSSSERTLYFYRGPARNGNEIVSVFAADGQHGVALPALGLPNSVESGESWLAKSQVSGFMNKRNLLGVDPLTGRASYFGQEAENPLVAFGASLGGDSLPVDQQHRVAITCGTEAYFYIVVISKKTGARIDSPYLIPVGNSNDFFSWQYYIGAGQSSTVEVQGLKLRFQRISHLEGDESIFEDGNVSYLITHEPTKDAADKVYMIFGAGGVRQEGPQFPLDKKSLSDKIFYSGYFKTSGTKITNEYLPIGLGKTGETFDQKYIYQSTYIPLYSIDFDERQAWQSKFLDSPKFSAELLPPQYAGKSAQALLFGQPAPNWQPPIDPASAKTLNGSPELRPHSTLDRLVQDLTEGLGSEEEKAVALANFVLNEMELSEPMGKSAESDFTQASIDQGGVSRGAYATYMEGQGSPAELCALQVYLLRRAGIPALYVFPEWNQQMLLNSQVSAMLGMQIEGALREDGQNEPVTDSARPWLVAVNYPWVACHVGGRWVHLFPWLKDIEVKEGFELFDNFSHPWSNPMEWGRKYLDLHPEIMKFRQGTRDTLADILPGFAREQLAKKGLTLADIGLQHKQRRINRASLAEFPHPFELRGLPSAILGLSERPNIFNTMYLKVGSKVLIPEADEFPLLELHNRNLFFSQDGDKPTTAGSLSLTIDLKPFDEKAAWATPNTVTKFVADGSAQKVRLLNIVKNTKNAGIPVEVKILQNRAYDWTAFAKLPNKWETYLNTYLSPEITQSLSLPSGDAGVLCMNFGRVSERMVQVHANAFWKAQGDASQAEKMDVRVGLPLNLLGMSYFNRIDRFTRQLEDWFKIRNFSHFGAGFSRLAAAKENGIIKDFKLVTPIVDMTTLDSRKISRSDLGYQSRLWRETGLMLLHTLNASAEEHASINEFYGENDAVSTVKLLQLSGGLTPALGSLIDPRRTLYANNWVMEGETTYPSPVDPTAIKRLKNWDPKIWSGVKEMFEASYGDWSMAYLTPGPVVGAKGAFVGMGALLLKSSSSHSYGAAALISGNLNGGYGSSFSNTEKFESDNFANLTLLSTSSGGYWLSDSGDTSSSFQTPLGSIHYNAATTYSNANAWSVGMSALSWANLNYSTVASTIMGISFAGSTPSASELADVHRITTSNGFLGDTSWYGAPWNFIFDPVDVITGAFYHDEVDLTLPGQFPLQIRRNYSSDNPAAGQFGYGWRSSMVPYLVLPKNDDETDSDPVSAPSNTIYAAEMDGSVLAYERDGESEIWRPTLERNPHLANILKTEIGAGANMLNAKITRTLANNSATYTLSSPDGSIRTFRVRSYPMPENPPQDDESEATDPEPTPTPEGGWGGGIGTPLPPLPPITANPPEPEIDPTEPAISRKRPYLTSWKDASGNELNFVFYEDNSRPDYGQLKRITSNSGMFVGFNYDPYGRIVEAFTSDGRWLYYSYDHEGDLREVIRPDNSVLKYEYDYDETGHSTHQIIRELKPEGRILVNEYDASGRVKKQFANVGQNGEVVQNAGFEYPERTEGADGAFSGRTVVTDGLNHSTTYHYANNQITQIIEPEERTTSYDWFTVGEESKPGYYPRSIERITDPRGLETRFEYDAAGNVKKRIVSGELTGEGNAESMLTETDWNSRHLPETVNLSGNRQIKYFYEDATQPYLATRIEEYAGGVKVKWTSRSFTNVGNATIGAKGVLQHEVITGLRGIPVVTTYTRGPRGFPEKITQETGTNDPDMVVIQRHNLRGELVEETDVLGRKTAFAYDAMGRRIWIERRDETGALVWWDYQYFDGNGENTWSDGPRYYPEDYVWRHYDGGGRLKEEIRWRTAANSGGTGVVGLLDGNDFAVTKNDYDVFGNLKESILPGGLTVKMPDYDGVGRMKKKVVYESSAANASVISTESFTYEPGGEVEVHTNALGGNTTILYTQNGLRKQVTTPANLVTKWEYDLLGRVVKETLPSLSYWSTAYDDAQLKETRTLHNPSGAVLATEVFLRDFRGEVVSQTDALGYVFETTFDGLGRVKTEFGPETTPTAARRVTTHTYDAAGRIHVVANALNESTTTTFDAIGRTTLVTISGADNQIVKRTSTAYRPDHHGSTTSEGSGSSATWTTTFTNNDGQPVIVRHADGYRTTAYDVAGNPVTFFDEMGQVTSRTFYPHGLLRTETLPGNATTTFEYDPVGNLTKRTLPGGALYSAKFDSALRMEWETSARQKSFTYHPQGASGAGRLKTETDGRGITKTFTYDAFGRLDLLTTAGSQPETSPEMSMSLDYGYNARGELTSISQSGGLQLPNVVTRTYTPYGQIETETVKVNEVTISSLQQTWDAAGRRKRLGPPITGTPGWTFDYRADGAMTTSGYASHLASFSYNDASRLDHSSFAGLTRQVMARDGRGRPSQIEHALQSTVQMRESFFRQADGKLRQRIIQRGAGHSLGEETRHYHYTANGRHLAGETLWNNTFLSHQIDSGQTHGIGAITRLELGAASMGNPAGSPWHVRTLTPTARGAVQGFSEADGEWSQWHDFDGQGQQTQRQIWGPDYFHKENSLWDALERLVEHTIPSFSFVDKATYDGLGRRLRLAKDSGQDQILWSIYDPEVEFLELELRESATGGETGAQRVRKIYGPDTSGAYGGNQGEGGLVGALEATGLVRAVVSDGLGDAVARTKEGVWEWTHTNLTSYGGSPPWQETLGEAKMTDYTRSVSWRGRTGDMGGLTYMGARYYEPRTRSFVSADPLDYEAGINLYSYAGGDPVNLTDPDGRFGKGVGSGWNGSVSSSSPNSWAFNLGTSISSPISGYYSGLGQGIQNVSGYTALQGNLDYYGGDYYQSLNMTYNPIAIGSVKYAEAFGGIGYSYDNSGQSLNTSERLMSFGVGTLNFAAVLGPLEVSVNAYSSSLSASLRLQSLSAARGAGTFFEGAKYSPKVLQQMNKAADVQHAFPSSVDGFATKFGQWTTKTGADGKTYQWLEMRGSYGGKTGTFEYIKDSNGVINHRYLKPD